MAYENRPTRGETGIDVCVGLTIKSYCEVVQRPIHPEAHKRTNKIHDRDGSTVVFFLPPVARRVSITSPARRDPTEACNYYSFSRFFRGLPIRANSVSNKEIKIYRNGNRIGV